MKNKRINYKKGAILGFIFGIVGLWIIALLVLIVPPLEIVTKPLFWCGRIINNTVLSKNIKIMYLIYGIAYAVIGVIIQFIVGAIKKQRK